MNAKKELYNHLNNILKPWHEIMCAWVRLGDEFMDEDGEATNFHLKFGFTIEEFSNFIGGLDIEYDSGYGGQYLFGTIWYNDGTWSERGEYDGSEWWEYKAVPEIPKECKRNV